MDFHGDCVVFPRSFRGNPWSPHGSTLLVFMVTPRNNIYGAHTMELRVRETYEICMEILWHF